MSELATVPCRGCRREFASNKTPMAEQGVCMMCRPRFTVFCVYCAVRCPGAYDGLMLCQVHRAMPAVELRLLTKAVRPMEGPA